MAVFKIKKDSLKRIKQEKLKLEKDLQKTTEKNLETIFGLKFITSEFQLKNLRIDTLAFDTETKSFVIIEYKRDHSFSVIDQGFAYLALMLNNKADFVLEYNEKNKEALSRGEVDWSQSGIIFIANRFTQHQLKAINFQDLPIELWEVQEYENSLIKYEQLRTPGASASIKDLSTDQTISKVSQEVKKYTIEDHFKEDWENSRELFEAFREQLLSFEERFEETPLKKYIGYKLANKNLCEVVAQKSGLKIYLDIQKNALQDPENMTRDVSEVGHWGTGDTEFKLKKLGNVGYAMFLIKQIYKNFTNES